MNKSDFHYELPAELIAQAPLAERGASRLLCLDGASGSVRDRQFADLPELLGPDDLLVLNDTQVIPARLHGRKRSGGRVEILVERVLQPGSVLAHVRASKSPKAGAVIELDGGFAVTVGERHDDLYELHFPNADAETVLHAVGHMPLPPYVDRPDTALDRQRYQTVFARVPGAVAAPTAGLHFDAAMLARLADLGIKTAFVTLHVGAGTFQPLRVERLEDHVMHAERVEVPEATADRIDSTRQRGGRIVAVGTTVVRALESAAQGGSLSAWRGETNLFIRPGFPFRVIDAMVTNFHLSESTLLALVCAFAGRDAVLNAYRHAIAQRYRFFSYGDAMFVTRQAGALES